ncbi:MAG TPA: hypothetical protein VJ349_00640, partial [Stellaceae bacterium]|nr:hypothetical protein [Stellaceae bacterium]
KYLPRWPPLTIRQSAALLGTALGAGLGAGIGAAAGNAGKGAAIGAASGGALAIIGNADGDSPLEEAGFEPSVPRLG